jgi:S-adenosylmethionine decarboxylase
MQDLLEQCDFEILGFIDHHFQPQGYTCLWLLGESHLAVHTYPEHAKSYIELTSCVEPKNQLFVSLLEESEFSIEAS